MAMTYDATLKDLAGEYPRDFLTAFDGPPTLPVTPLNVDLSTVTLAADLVLGLDEPLREIVHIDFQASAMGHKHADILAYNVPLFREYEVPVHTIVILLRPQAAHSNLNGVVGYSARPGRGSMAFGYELIPLWERPAEELLGGAVGTLPLAVLGRLPPGVELQEGLTGIAQRMLQRLEAEASAERTQKLVTAAFLLTGLRLRRDVVRQVFRGVHFMRESDTYMAIIDEGREEEVKKTHPALRRGAIR